MKMNKTEFGRSLKIVPTKMQNFNFNSSENDRNKDFGTFESMKINKLLIFAPLTLPKIEF